SITVTAKPRRAANQWVGWAMCPAPAMIKRGAGAKNSKATRKPGSSPGDWMTTRWRPCPGFATHLSLVHSHHWDGKSAVHQNAPESATQRALAPTSMALLEAITVAITAGLPRARADLSSR